MKKRSAILIVSAILMLVVLTFQMTSLASAKDTMASGEWGDLSWMLDRSGNLTVSGEGPMDDFDMSKGGEA